MFFVILLSQLNSCLSLWCLIIISNITKQNIIYFYLRSWKKDIDICKCTMRDNDKERLYAFLFIEWDKYKDNKDYHDVYSFFCLCIERILTLNNLYRSMSRFAIVGFLLSGVPRSSMNLYSWATKWSFSSRGSSSELYISTQMLML